VVIFCHYSASWHGKGNFWYVCVIAAATMLGRRYDAIIGLASNWPDREKNNVTLGG